MTRFLSMKRLSILFVGLFVVSLAGVFVYQRIYIDPEEKCLAENRWWYPEERRCLTPLYLPNITGRAPGVSRAEASNEQNRELVDIEHRLAAEKAARQAQTDRDRALVTTGRSN
jgi:hypothetical protein